MLTICLICLGDILIDAMGSMHRCWIRCVLLERHAFASLDFKDT